MNDINFLVISNDKDITVALDSIVKRLSGNSMFVQTREEAINLIDSGRYTPDVILLQTLGEGLDGVRIYDELRSKDITKDTPLIFVPRGITIPGQIFKLIESKSAAYVDHYSVNSITDALRRISASLENILVKGMSISDMQKLLNPTFGDDVELPDPIYCGKPVYAGAASGKLRTDTNRAFEDILHGESIISFVEDVTKLTRRDTRLIKRASGAIYHNISLLDHQCIDFKNSGMPMIECGDIRLASECDNLVLQLGETLIRDGEYMSFDGSNGSIFLGKFPIKASLIERYHKKEKLSPYEDDSIKRFNEVISECDKELDGKTEVWINADDVCTLKKAHEFGAKKVALSRTENVIRGTNNTELYCAYLLALTSDSKKLKSEFTEEFKRLYTERYSGFLKLQRDRWTQIRLIDLPPNEFIDDDLVNKVKNRYKGTFTEGIVSAFEAKIKDPKSGFGDARGVQISKHCPEIYRAQLEVFYSLVDELRGINPQLKVIVPFLSNFEEFQRVKDIYKSICGDNEPFKLGVTLEVPSATYNADELLKAGIRFFSIGTNDLYNLMSGGGNRAFYKEDGKGNEPDYFIPNFIKGIVLKVVKAAKEEGIPRNEYTIGIAGEINQEKLFTWKDIIPMLHYVSAGRPSQIPEIKLLLAQANFPSFEEYMKKLKSD